MPMNEINWKEKMKQNGLNHSFAHIQQQSCWKIARSWMAKVMLLILLFFVLCWQLIDSISMLHDRRLEMHSPPGHQKRDNLERIKDDVFCLDRYGRPISRNEVTLTKYSEMRKNSFMVIAIPTIERKKGGKKYFYLEQTLKSLLSRLSSEAKRETVIVILCADTDPEKRERVKERIEKSFLVELYSGLIQLIYAPERFYSSVTNLPITFNNTPARMKWRAKQSLDYAFLFYYCDGVSKYYLQLEDDVTIEDGFYEHIKRDLKGFDKQQNFILLHYYKLGFIGKLIDSRYLQMFADMFRIYYFEMPLDWTYYRAVFFIGAEHRALAGSKFLFHHIGNYSSSDNN